MSFGYFGEDTGQPDIDEGTEKRKNGKDDSGGGFSDILKYGAMLSSAAAPLCASACGDSKDKEQQKDYINQQHPLTGDPATDKQIQAQRDAQFKAWQTADDQKKFDNLPPEMKAMLPAAKQFVDRVASMLPPEAMNMTLLEAAAKYPDVAAQAWAAIQTAVPSLKGMPLDYALALAKSSGLGDTKLSDIKSRVDTLYAAKAGAAASAAGSSVATMAIGGLAVGALLLGGFALLKKRK